jgi:4-amino-4-deoxy-L-arabinose transferase-like glycosyltransferase
VLHWITCAGASVSISSQTACRSATAHFLPVVTILLLAAFCRFHTLGQDERLHPDEALYATYARSAAVHGDWTLPGALDKPPLSIYVAALSMHFNAAHITDKNVIDVTVRQGEFAARWPNVLAGIALVALTYTLATVLFPGEGRGSALLAGLLTAVSPYLIVFSASAFTDMLMLMLMVSALLAGVRNRPVLCGLLLALSIAAKPQGAFYLPLVIGAVWAIRGMSWRWLLQSGLALGTGLAALLAWDFARPETSVFVLAMVNSDPGRHFITLEEVLPRLYIWMDHAGWLLSAPPVTLLLAALALWIAASQRQRVDLLLWSYVGLYAGLHWLTAVNTIDRYLLPLVPLLAIVAARGVYGLYYRIRSIRIRTAGVMLVLSVLFLAAYLGADRRLDIGGGGYIQQGNIINLADYLNDKPLGTIIYDRWHGWELGYYLGAWTDKRRVYYPSPQIMAEDALLNPDPAPRYFVAPQGQDVTPWLKALAQAGFQLLQDETVVDFALYMLIPPSSEDA